MVTEEGIVICFNNEYLSKALFPISITEDRIIICFNDLQHENVYFLIIFMVEGNSICDKDEYSAKA